MHLDHGLSPSLACTAPAASLFEERLWTYYTEVRQIAALGWLGHVTPGQQALPVDSPLRVDAPFHLCDAFILGPLCPRKREGLSGWALGPHLWLLGSSDPRAQAEQSVLPGGTGWLTWLGTPTPALLSVLCARPSWLP